VTSRQYGLYYDHVINEPVNFHEYVDAFASKPPPNHGDHKTPMNWGRLCGNVVANEPASLHRIVHEGEGEHRRVLIDVYVDNYFTENDYVPFSFTVPNPGSGNAFDASRTKALNKLKPDSSGWGENIGQGKKTIEEFATLASHFAQALLALKKGNLKLAATNLVGLPGKKRNLRSAQKTAADLWLQYQYGIRPVLQDIHDLHKSVIDILKKPLPFEVHKTEISTYERHNGPGDVWAYDAVSVASHRTQLNALITNPMTYLLDSAGLINPAEIAWELLPWSFAIDWFVPIGQTLKATTVGVGLEDNGGWTTSRTDSSLTWKRIISSETGDGYRYSSPGNYVEKQSSFNRACFTSWPAPAFYANENPYKTERALNAIALIRQLA